MQELDRLPAGHRPPPRGRRRDPGLCASGPAFCAGHDLKELVDRAAAAYCEVCEACTRLIETIQSVPQPVIAQVHGLATAAGCQLPLVIQKGATW